MGGKCIGCCKTTIKLAGNGKKSFCSEKGKRVMRNKIKQ
jgi:hypothetical protein